MSNSDPTLAADSASADTSWHWFLPTSGDGNHLSNVINTAGQTEAGLQRGADLDYLTQLGLAVERAGFDAVLTPTGSGCEDAWVACSAVAARTRRLRFIVAFRPDAIHPSWAAHQAASLQRLSGGRLILHVVSGGDPAEQKAFGDHHDKQARYRRTDEFLDVLKQTWTGERFDHQGEFFHIEDGGLRRPLAPLPRPPIFFGGASTPAEIVAARRADVYLMWGEPVATIGERVRHLRELAAVEGREFSFGIRLHVIARDTSEEAWREADRLLEGISPEAIAAAQSRFSRMESVGQARMNALNGGRTDNLVIAPNLWAGVGLIREGAGTAIVGSHEEVAERLLEYKAAGCDHFILSGYPHLEEALRFGETVRPLLDRALAPA